MDYKRDLMVFNDETFTCKWKSSCLSFDTEQELVDHIHSHHIDKSCLNLTSSLTESLCKNSNNPYHTCNEFCKSNTSTSNDIKYAVVTWYNYRKELYADFNKYFKDYESARIFALNLAKKDMDMSKLNMEEKMFIESQTDETSMLSDETQEKIKELEEKTEECYNNY